MGLWSPQKCAKLFATICTLVCDRNIEELKVGKELMGQ